jgi:hypothetical protein
MKLSALVSALDGILREHGDVEVVLYGDGYSEGEQDFDPCVIDTGSRASPGPKVLYLT